MATTAQWTPDPDAIAALLPQRTGDPSGRALTSWSDTTVPSLAQVQVVINQVVAEVAGTVGIVPDDDVAGLRPSIIDMAKRIVALGAASYVELSFYPDQNVGGMGVGDQFYARYQKALSGLLQTVQTVNSGSSAGGADMAAPVYSFPDMTDIPTPSAPLTTYAERF